MLRLLGAELIEVPAVPYKNPNNYVKLSGRLAEQLAKSEPNGAIWANQFDNVANREGHIETTAPEIWDQTGGKVDGFICAVGTGGTLAGVAMGLKAQEQGCDDRPRRPDGRRALQLLHGRRAEGRGQLDHRGHRPGPHHRQSRRLRGRLRLSDPRRGGAADRLRPRSRRKGLCLGGSTGINIAGAIRLARELGPGHTIVTVLCDYGTRYQSQALQPGIPARQGPAGAGLARQSRASRSGRLRVGYRIRHD